MKHVRTARGYESLVVTHDGKQHTVSASPLEVSNEAADAIQTAAEGAGVAVVVGDSAEEVAGSSVQPQPDLSAGVSAVSGTGDPVTTPGTTTEPDTGTTKKKAGN